MRENTVAALKLSAPASRHLPGPNILVLDASAAIPLSYPIPEAFFDPSCGMDKADRPKTYLDLLKRLPQNMVAEIHIPNIVVHEMIGYACYRDPKGGKLISKQVEPAYEHYGGFEARYQFLKAALEGKYTGYPKIVIDCPPETEAYMHTLIENAAALERTPRGYHVRRAHNTDHQHYFENDGERLKKEITIDTFRITAGKNKGEIQCAQLAYDYLGKEKASAIVLMDDGWGIHTLAHHMEVFRKNYHVPPKLCALNSRAFLSALKEAGVLWEAGFDAKVTESDISQNITDQQRKAAAALKTDKEFNYHVPAFRYEGFNFGSRLQSMMQNGRY